MRNLFILIILMTSLAGAAPIKIEGPGPNWEWHQTDKLHGNVVVITVVSRYTKKESYFVNWKISSKLINNKNLKMMTVIDFIGIPHSGFVYNYARHRIINETSRVNNQLIMQGASPIEYICDVSETLRNTLNADPRHRVDIIILDKNGEVRGHFYGASGIADAIKLIEQLTKDK
jgi:hypothetical protein